jgi:hypothetical protein
MSSSTEPVVRRKVAKTGGEPTYSAVTKVMDADKFRCTVTIVNGSNGLHSNNSRGTVSAAAALAAHKSRRRTSCRGWRHARGHPPSSPTRLHGDCAATTEAPCCRAVDLGAHKSLPTVGPVFCDAHEQVDPNGVKPRSLRPLSSTSGPTVAGRDSAIHALHPSRHRLLPHSAAPLLAPCSSSSKPSTALYLSSSNTN